MDGKKLYPLTHPQKRIWYTEKLHPGTGMWNNAGTIKVKGPLNVALMEKAVNHVIKNNEALRIRISQVDGEPFQYVNEYEQRRLDYFDFSHTNISELYEWDSMQSQMQMPLLDNNLCYFAIVKISETECGLYSKVHHIISDAWSIVMVCNQIMENYDRLLSSGELHELTGGSYIDYIAKEKEYIDSKRFAFDEAALNKIFADLPEPTILKQKKSNYTSTRARRKACIMNKTLADKMRDYCSTKDSTVFAVYLAALCIYISRVLNKDDIIIGVPVFNRTSQEEKNTVGMFVSTVPIRIKVKDDMDFNAFVENVSNEWFRILKHQKYPYDMLLSNLRKKNKLDALYDITLSYQNARFEKNTSNLYYEGRWHFAGSQVHSISIHINDREGEGRLIVDYDHLVPLFSIKEIEYIHSHCETILSDALAYPEKKLYELNVMPQEEWNRVLYAFNSNKADYPMDRGLDALFLEQVNRTPDGIALVAGKDVLTYRQLNGQVNKAAHYLISKGVGPGGIAGIMIVRDTSLIVFILAVLRAGGAYLPIDPDYPDERVQYALGESEAVCVIASPHLAAKCGTVSEIIVSDILESLPDN
ncbi:MAG: condensation domain-containing protein, partial [Eubacteriales bacterium]